MSPKRLTPPEVEPGEDLTEQNIAAYEALAVVLDNLGDSEAVLKIMRRAKTGGMEFCEQVAADPSFSPQYIKENWGGGVYSIQLWGPKPGEVGTKYLKSVTVKIAGVSKEKKEPEPGATQAGHASGDPAVIALQLELATLKGMLAGMQAKGEQANPLDNLEKLTTVMRNLMPPQAPTGGAMPSEILQFARDAVGLAKEFTPEPVTEGVPWGLIAEKIVEPSIGLIGQALAAQKAGAPLPAVNPVAEIPATTTGAPMWQVELAKIVPRLLKRARDGKDPELAAELFLEDAPGGAVEQLAALAPDENFVPTVLALAEQNFPDVTPVRAWVQAFLEAVREQLLPEPVPDGTPALKVEVSEKPKREKREKGAPDASVS